MYLYSHSPFFSSRRRGRPGSRSRPNAAKRWGIGIVGEWVASDQAIREWLVIALINWHFYKEWKLAFGPGGEVVRESGAFELAFRIGLAYEFPLSDGWTLAPEFNADFLKDEALTLLYGVAIGREF